MFKMASENLGLHELTSEKKICKFAKDREISLAKKNS